DAQILRTSSLTLDRTKEAEMLCSEELKDYLKEHDIHLYTYDEIGH
ncbi:MAG TPA: PTS sugar transporter, partial [Catenibacterium sp.]|nr:PTS sugar transporter [Catenibacterium sp.]